MVRKNIMVTCLSGSRLPYSAYYSSIYVRVQGFVFIYSKRSITYYIYTTFSPSIFWLRTLKLFLFNNSCGQSSNEQEVASVYEVGCPVL